MLFPEYLKAFCIGICASVPLGPIAILVMQKSLCYGHRAGFITGLGATTIDTTYATVSIFALALAQDLITRYNCLIYLVGGVIVGLLGAKMAFKDPFKKLGRMEDERGASIGDYAQAVLTALSNPGAIFVMMALFAFFGLDTTEAGAPRILFLILSVAGGSACYWFFFSRLFSHLRESFNIKTMFWMSRVAGIIIMIIGFALFAEGLYDAVFRGGLSSLQY